MQRRITGLETEYGVVGRRPDGSTVPGEEVVRALLAPLKEYEAPGQINHFLRNGSRVYMDVGEHPEHGGPECTSWRAVLVYDRAGDERMGRLATQAEEAREAAGKPMRVTVLKNNVDGTGRITYGCHENYLVERATDHGELMPLLTSVLASRTVLTGAGSIVSDDESARYVLSQRAGHMVGQYGSPTTRHRNMVSDRDEPHALKELWWRLHVIVGDSNLADVATALKVGTGAMTLRVFEEGHDDPSLHLQSPLRALRATSDRGLEAVLERVVGGTITALDHQELVLERSEKLASAEGVSPLERELLDLWAETIALLRRGWEAAAGTLDWATKLSLLTRLQERKGCAWGDPRMRAVDLAYHDVRTGLARELRERGSLRTLVTPDEVEEALDVPPQDTRAAVRGRALEEAGRAGVPLVMSWGEVRLAGGSVHEHVVLPDPFDWENTEVEELVRERVRSRNEEDEESAETGAGELTLWVPGAGEVSVPPGLLRP